MYVICHIYFVIIFTDIYMPKHSYKLTYKTYKVINQRL